MIQKNMMNLSFKVYIQLVFYCILKAIHRLNDLSGLSEPGVCAQGRQTVRQPDDQPQVV